MASHLKLLPDSGHRHSYGKGLAVREADPNKSSLEGISPFALKRLGMLLTKANAKYGNYRNWEKGMPIMRYVGGILRHTAEYEIGDTSEDHLAAIMWNAMCVMHHEEVGSTSGFTFEELDDRPRWKETMEKARAQMGGRRASKRRQSERRGQARRKPR